MIGGMNFIRIRTQHVSWRNSSRVKLYGFTDFTTYSRKTDLQNWSLVYDQHGEPDRVHTPARFVRRDDWTTAVLDPCSTRCPVL